MSSTQLIAHATRKAVSYCRSTLNFYTTYMSKEPYAITAFYKFLPVSSPEKLQASLSKKGKFLGIRGLVLVASEGINGTVSGSPEAISAWKEVLQETVGDIECKDSFAETDPCKRFFVKVREEIVGLGDKSIVPNGPNNHISPKEWHEMMQGEDVVVLDARNTYETEIGVFKGAIDPKLEKFSDFGQYVQECDIPKDKKVLMYCTGGIRCEKASIEMQKRGYEHVYQLQGGILKYLEQYPEGLFEGECFVFDHRTSVDTRLQPSKKYHLCPHCGDPGDRHVTCEQCGDNGVICHRCETKEHKKTCSKDCAHHHAIGSHSSKKKAQVAAI